MNTGGKLFYIDNINESSSYHHPKEIPAVPGPNGVGTGTVDRNGVIIQYVRESEYFILPLRFKR